MCVWVKYCKYYVQHCAHIRPSLALQYNTIAQLLVWNVQGVYVTHSVHKSVCPRVNTQQHYGWLYPVETLQYNYVCLTVEIIDVKYAQLAGCVYVTYIICRLSTTYVQVSTLCVSVRHSVYSTRDTTVRIEVWLNTHSSVNVGYGWRR